MEQDVKKTGYLDRQFTITGISDELMQWFVKKGMAREIHVPACISNDEIDTWVDTEKPCKIMDKS